MEISTGVEITWCERLGRRVYVILVPAWEGLVRSYGGPQLAPPLHIRVADEETSTMIRHTRTADNSNQRLEGGFDPPSIRMDPVHALLECRKNRSIAGCRRLILLAGRDVIVLAAPGHPDDFPRQVQHG